MIIWILAILVLAGLASAGYSQGAIRVAFSLVGIFAGLFLAIPVSPAVIVALPLLGITSLWWQQIVGTVVAFFLVGVVFKVGGAVVHRKVDYHFKYRMPDAVRALWERMHRRVGLCLGLVNGWVYFMLICLLISVLGYFTTQTGASESGTATLRFFNKMALDLQTTRMDRVVGGINPAPARYYEVSDFLGFVLNNRPVISRFKTYPPFAVMVKKPLWQGVSTDKEYIKTLDTEPDPAVILNHPRTQEVLTNSEAMTELWAVDLNDLTAHLMTGKSPKFTNERIMGTWVYNYPASLKRAVQQDRNMKMNVMMRLRKELAERYAGAVLVATLDNKVTIQLPANIEGTPSPSITNSPPRTSFAGTWRSSGRDYHLSLSPTYRSWRPGGSDAAATSSDAEMEKQQVTRGGRDVEVERILFKIYDNPVVFDKIPE